MNESPRMSPNAESVRAQFMTFRVRRLRKRQRAVLGAWGASILVALFLGVFIGVYSVPLFSRIYLAYGGVMLAVVMGAMYISRSRRHVQAAEADMDVAVRRRQIAFRGY